MKRKLKHLLKRRDDQGEEQEAKSRYDEAIQTLPRITSETVAAHREEVLSSARKYIYPLQHSKHRIVLISASLLAFAAVTFATYCTLALYHFHSDSSFLYRVTQVIPVPVAKAGPHYIAYENYLFELRHYEHYYKTQQAVDFGSQSGKQQLEAFKKQALQQVIDAAYVKQLAAEHKVSVSDQEVNDEITLVRAQNRLGSNDRVFEGVLKEFWGWSVDDFKRELKTQLLAQKVVSVLDTSTHQRAEAALKQLQQGADFAALAGQVSEETASKANGGNFGVTIDKNSQNLPPQTINALFGLQVGQISGIVNIGYGLEIDKLAANDNGKLQAAHIVFNFKNINEYLAPLKQTQKIHSFIKP